MHPSTSALMLALALACVTRPSAAQDARACANEVQRLSETFQLTDATDRQSTAIAQEPGAREGASLGNEQRERIGGLVRQARTAGEQGDGERCLRSLTEARALLRQAGIGAAQPGSAFGADSDIGSVGSGGSSAASPSGADLGAPGAGGVGGAMSDTVGPAADLPPGGDATGGSTLGGTSGGTVGGAVGGSTGGGTSSSGGGSP